MNRLDKAQRMAEYCRDWGSDINKIKIIDLGLSTRTSRCLDNASITTIGELALRSEAELMKIKGFGEKSILEVGNCLALFGVKLICRKKPKGKTIAAAIRMLEKLGYSVSKQ